MSFTFHYKGGQSSPSIMLPKKPGLIKPPAFRASKPNDFSMDDIFGDSSHQGLVLPKKIIKSGSASDLDSIVVDNAADMNKLLDKIVAEFGSGLPRDLKIDDSDIPLAKNFVDWSYNKKFIGNTEPEYPFPKQIQIAINFLNEYCRNPKCSDVSFAKDITVDASTDEILSRVTMLEWGKCPKCGLTRIDLWEKPEFECPRFYELIGIAGQRSGKTAGVNLINYYQFHRMLKLNRPQKVFGTQEATWLETTFTATTFAKAKKNFFDPLVSTFKNHPWFVQYTDMLDHYGQKHGEELYKVLNQVAAFAHRKYLFQPDSPSPQNLRGATRYCIAGSELINCNKGLIPISSKDKILYSKAAYKTGNFNITNHFNNGYKRCYNIATEYGYDLVCTKDHEILTIDDKLVSKMKPLENIKVGDYVGIQLGGDFSKVDLSLDYKYEVLTPVYRQILEWLVNVSTFTFTDLNNIFPSSATGTKLRELCKKRAVTKVKWGLYQSNVKNPEDFFDKKFDDRINFINPSKMTKELAYLLGYFVSEGSYNLDCTEFQFPNNDIRVINHFASCYESVFGIKCAITSFNNGGTVNYKCRVAYKNIKEFFRYVGLKSSLAHNKSIPWSILESKKEHCEAFLQALFEGDGCTSRGIVSYTSKSSQLIKELQVLLLKFNIVSKKEKRRFTADNGKYYYNYSIRLPKYDSFKYITTIGFFTKNERHLYSGVDRLPKHYRIPHIENLINRSGKTQFNTVVSSEFDVITPKSWSYSIEYLKNIDQAVYIRALGLVDQNIIWLKVKDIKDVGGRFVYDITVEDVHKYSASGFVVHNCAEIDEISHIYTRTEDAINLNPSELHTSLSNSLTTLHAAYSRILKRGLYDIPQPMMCNITSPRALNDFGIKLYSESQKPHSTIYGFHYSVYEMNPYMKGDKFLEQRKAIDPEGFKRDYLAIAPSAHNAFVDDKNIIKATIRKDHPNAIQLTPRYIRGHAKNVKAMSADMIERVTKKTINKHSNKVMTLDAGSSRNSFAITVGHLEVHFPEENIREIKKVIDICAEVIPKDGRIISFPDLYDNVIAPIINDFNVIFISADRWNSMQVLQQASDDFDIPYSIYSCRMKDFLHWKGSVYSGDFQMPQPEVTIDQAFSLASDNYPICFEGKPVAHALLQMLTVENNMNKSVDKGGNYTDDIFRALVLCDKWLSDDDLREELMASREPETDPNAFVGVYSSGSGGITTLSGANINPQQGGGNGNTNSVGAISSLLPFGNR